MSERAEQPKLSAEAAAKEAKEKTEFARLLDKSIHVGDTGVEIKTLEDLRRLAGYILDGGLATKGDTISSVVTKIAAGLELGFQPMRAVAVLTSINGRIGIMGDAARALIQSKGVLTPGTAIRVVVTGTGDARVATCTTQRKGWPIAIETTFSVADAKLARLWGKSGPWSEYPERMLGYRALGFHVRDHYSDVLMGFSLAEEIRDFSDFPRAEAAAPRELPPADTSPDPIFDADESARLDAEIAEAEK